MAEQLLIDERTKQASEVKSLHNEIAGFKQMSEGLTKVNEELKAQILVS